MSRNTISKIFLLFLLAIVLAGVARILFPFTGPLISALVVGIAFHPMHRHIQRKCGKRWPSLAAGISDAIILILLILPVGLLVWGLATESEKLDPLLKQWQATLDAWHQGQPGVAGPAVWTLKGWMGETLGIGQEQFRRDLIHLADWVQATMAALGTDIAKHAFSFLFSILVLLVTLFFVFRDGDYLVGAFRKYLPLQESQKSDLFEKVAQTIDGVIRGWFITALIQGVTASIGYYIVKIPAAALFGVLTAIAGLIPSIGTTLVWLPMTGILALTHHYWSATFIFVWGVVVIGLLDNLLRPYLIGTKAEIPLLYLFFGILGGVEVWGPAGIIIGPIFVSLAPLLLEMNWESYLTQPPKRPSEVLTQLPVAARGDDRRRFWMRWR